MQRVYIYRKYVRLWHWVQAGSILALIISGLMIHFPAATGAFSLHPAVNAHHLAAAVLLLNGLLGLFFYITTGEIRQLSIQLRGMLESAVAQARYYTQGIFKGAPYPFEKTPARRLNPLQRITYIAVMFFLLPLQVVSGSLLWLGGHQYIALPPELTLTGLSLAHTLAAWLFCSFLLMHIYLTTTGRTPLANIQAMVTGWEENGHAPGQKGGHADG